MINIRAGAGNAEFEENLNMAADAVAAAACEVDLKGRRRREKLVCAVVI